MYKKVENHRKKIKLYKKVEKMIKDILQKHFCYQLNFNQRKKVARCVFVRTKTISPGLWLVVKPSRLRF